MKKYLPSISVFILVLILIIGVFFLTTCSITTRVEQAEHLRKEEKVYREHFIQNYERKHQKQQAILKKTGTIKSEDIKLYLDSIDNEKRMMMNSLFDRWHDTMTKQHNNLIELGEASSKNLSIWLAVIAAVCTVLPIVLVINQNESFNEKIKDYKEKIDKQSIEIERFDGHIEITKRLDTISRNLNILCDMQEFDNRENIRLTSLEETKFYIHLIEKSTEECVIKYNMTASKLKEEDIRLIYNAVLCTLYNLRAMLFRFENAFTGRNLMQLQQIRYAVSMNIKSAMSEEEKASFDVSALLAGMFVHVANLNRLFNNENP